MDRRDYFCENQTHYEGDLEDSTRCLAHMNEGHVPNCPYSFEDLENLGGEVKPIVPCEGGDGVCRDFYPIGGLELALSYSLEVEIGRRNIGSYDVLEVVGGID